MSGIVLKRKTNFKRETFDFEGHPLDGQPIIRVITADQNEDEEEIVADSRIDCQFCGRFFVPESFPVHQKACKEVFMGRRRPFLSGYQRLCTLYNEAE